MDASIPWEDTARPFVDRVWTTVRGMTLDPVRAFSMLGAADGERDLRLATQFALITTVFGWAPMLLLTPCLVILPIAFVEALPDDARGLGLGVFCAIAGSFPFLLVLGSLGTELVHGLVFHGICRLLGGRGAFRASLHAMLYTAAIRFWLCPGMLLGFVPFIGGMMQIALRGGFIVWTGVAAYGAAKGLHKLDESTSVVVGIFTPLLSMALVTFVIAGTVFAMAAAIMGTGALAEVLHNHGP